MVQILNVKFALTANVYMLYACCKWWFIIIIFFIEFVFYNYIISVLSVYFFYRHIIKCIPISNLCVKKQVVYNN